MPRNVDSLSSKYLDPAIIGPCFPTPGPNIRAVSESSSLSRSTSYSLEENVELILGEIVM